MRRSIKLKYVDFWSSFSPLRCSLTRLIQQRYDVEFCDDPDFLIYSCFGKQHLKYSCTRIFYTGENRRPDFRFCDYAFSFDYLDHPNNYRLPLFALSPHYAAAVAPVEVEKVLAEKTHFCNFVYSNRRCRTRNRFFKKLSKYKRVDAGGRLFNNIGGPVADKLAFLRRYKFTIAFENASHPGYTTEKILEPMSAHSLPIYWGNRLIHHDFNPRSYINYHEHGSDEAVIERIIEVDRNVDLYVEYLQQPYLHNNQLDPRFQADALLSQFERIFESSKIPVAQTRRNYYYLDRVASRLTHKTARTAERLRRLLRQE